MINLPLTLIRDINGIDYRVNDATGLPIMIETAYYPSAPDVDAAALLVRAVNNHEPLIKALEDMIENFKPFTLKPVGAPNSSARAEQEVQVVAYEQARTTLKAAKGN